MSNEIQFPYTPDRTVYFIVLNAAGQAWNGSAFETLLDANWANYDVPLTEQGTITGIYLGSFPSAIAASGRYSLLFYERLGGTPAVTDLLDTTGSLQWDGTGVVSPASLDIRSWAKSRIPALADADIDREASVFITEMLELYPCLGVSYDAITGTTKTFFDKGIGLLVAEALHSSSSKQTPSGDLVRVKLNDKEFQFSDKAASGISVPMQCAKDAARAFGSIACIKAAKRAALNTSSFRVSGPTRTARESRTHTSLSDDITRLLDPTWGTR